MILPKPRKVPKQSRSIMLVKSVKDACRQVLDNEGVSSLTTAHLAEVAGISVGSLYQYFPNLESVVAAVYDDIVLDYLEGRKEQSIQNLQEQPLKEALFSLIDRLIKFHQSLLELNYDFHRQYHRCFELDRSFNELFDRPGFIIHLVADAIRREGLSNDEVEIKLSAMMAMDCCKAVIMGVMDEDPQLIYREGLAEKIFNMCFAGLPKRAE